MCTKIRPNLSEKNKYWISRHRYYELKHFCLQYPIWKKAYAALDDLYLRSVKLDRMPSGTDLSNDTAKYGLMRAYYSERINMLVNVAKNADQDLYTYILKAVTEDLSYTYLKTKLNIPCSKDMYYDRYRRFFWLLSKERE